MSEWQAGDLALCVHDKSWSPHGGWRADDECTLIKSMLFPRVGSEWRVNAVQIHYRAEEDSDLVYLVLAGQPSDCAYDARHFRKIDKHEADEFDREVIEAMTGAPVGEPA